jgi:hypothetical protein
MTINRFSPVGRCIYCPNPGNLELSDEHIVPLGIRGHWILPDASCPTCRDVTSAFESHVLDNMMGPARAHLGLRRRNLKRPIKTITTFVGDLRTAPPSKMSLRDHPGALLMFSFGIPGIMLNLPPNPKFTGGRINVVQILPDFNERARRSGNAFINTKGFAAEPFARMLAKIAHGYTVARVGLINFHPLLMNSILGVEPLHLSSFVGTELFHEPPSSELHQLSLFQEKRSDGKEFHIVRIRLFSNYDTATHRVVTGEVT